MLYLLCWKFWYVLRLVLVSVPVHVEVLAFNLCLTTLCQYFDVVIPGASCTEIPSRSK